MSTTTSGTKSTTIRTPMTTLTTCTSTNSSTERAHVVLFLVHISSTLTLAQVRALSALSLHLHGHPRECSLFTLILSTLYFSAFFLSVFFSPFFHLSDEQQPELNKKIMENLCDSANNGDEGTYDVLYLAKSMLGSRRRSKKEISVLHWWFRNNCFYLRALQGHSEAISLILHYNHIGCAFNLHSIINNGLIPGGQSSSKRQTVFFLLVDLVDKSHKDPKVIDLNVPRRAQYLHNAWKIWVDIDLAIRKGLTFYQTRSNAIILQGILPAYCIRKVVRSKTGEVFMRKHTCHLDYHQRSRHVTIGQKVRFYWALESINNQKEKLFDSHKEKLLDKQNFSNQPNQSQSQSVIDQGNLTTRTSLNLSWLNFVALIRAKGRVDTRRPRSRGSGASPLNVVKFESSRKKGDGHEVHKIKDIGARHDNGQQCWRLSSLSIW